MAWKSALPGSSVAMCHQSIVTGSAAADDGAATRGARRGALGAAALAGALLAEPPLEQALIVNARTPSNPSVRLGFDMTRPPVIRHSSSDGCGACLVSAVSSWRSPDADPSGKAGAGAKVSVTRTIAFGPEP